jgi:hypothetical protein
VDVYSAEEKVKIHEDFGIHIGNLTENMDIHDICKEQESLAANFTEQPLDSTQNSFFKNATTKSVILAPFNSTISKTFSKWHTSVEDNIIDKKSVLAFGVRAKELDRQYEINNNSELDNGVYNNFAYKSPTTEGDEENYERVNEHVDENAVMDDDDDEEEEEGMKKNISIPIEGRSDLKKVMNSEETQNNLGFRFSDLMKGIDDDAEMTQAIAAAIKAENGEGTLDEG